MEALTQAELETDEGVEKITTLLDSIYVGEENDNMFKLFKDYTNCKKTDSISMIDYIIDFESKYNKLKAKNIVLPDALLGMQLLDNANLSADELKLAIACASNSAGRFTFDTSKKALNRLFGTTIINNDNNALTNIKKEAFYSNSSQNRAGFSRDTQGFQGYTRNQGFRHRPPFRPHQHPGPSNRPGFHGRGQRMLNAPAPNEHRYIRNNRGGPKIRLKNVIDKKTGEPTKCDKCESILHYLGEYPHKNEEIHYTNYDSQYDDYSAHNSQHDVSTPLHEHDMSNNDPYAIPDSYYDNQCASNEYNVMFTKSDNDVDFWS